MKYPKFQHNKRRLIASLLALSALQIPIVQAATIGSPTVITVTDSFSVDATATDFYIFGENVKKKDGPGLFTDVEAIPSGSLATASTSAITVAWSGGDPNDSSGSIEYDYIGFGTGFDPQDTSAEFTLTMPSAEGTLDFWLIPNGNTQDISYRVTVGDVQKELTGEDMFYQRFTYQITQATLGETITVTVDNVSGSNDWHNIGFQAAQFVISKATPTVNFVDPPTRGTVGQTVNLSVAANSGLNDVKLASDTRKVCTVNGNQVKFINSGICTVIASQMGDNNHLIAQVSLEIVVADPPTVLQSDHKYQVGDPAFSLNVKSSEELPVELSVDPQSQGICTLNRTLVTPVGVGTCIIRAFQAGNVTTNPAQAEYRIEIIPADKDEQSIVFSPVSVGIVGRTADLTATASSGLTVSFSSSPADICTVSGNTVSFASAGTCTITANQAGNEQFNAVEQQVDIDVASKGVSLLNFTDEKDNPLFQTVEGGTLKISLIYTASAADVEKTAKFYVKATAGNSVLMLTDKGFVPATSPLQAFISKTLSADKITLPLYTGALPAGEYSVYVAYETANGKEEVTSVFTVKGKQTVTFTNLPTSPKVGEKANLTLTGGNSSNPIVLTSTTTDVCTVQDKTVTFIAEGNCVIGANQAGNETFVDGNATGNIAVKSLGVFSLSVTDKDGKAITQAIDADTLNIGLTFKAPTDDVGKTATFYLTATAGTAKLMLVNGKWVTATNPLQATTSSVLSKDTTTLPLYSGALVAGNYTVYAKYQIEAKTVEATSVLNVISKVYADAYAKAYADLKSDDYAKAYATQKQAGKSDAFAFDYAIVKAVGATERFATVYAQQIEAGKSRTYAGAYATQIEAKEPVRYADAYALQIEAGKSDVYAVIYAQKIAAGKSTTYAVTYATAIDSGNSDRYATAYSTAIDSGKSQTYAGVYAEQIEVGNSEAYATQRASGKSTTYAIAYAKVKDVGYSDAYATAYAEQIEAGKSADYAGAYAGQIEAGKSTTYATTYAAAYEQAKIDWLKSSFQAKAYARARASGKSEADARAAAGL